MLARLSRLWPVGLAHALSESPGGSSTLTGTSSGWSRLCFDLAGLLITVLQVGQFVPQHVEMRSERSTAGLSPWLIFFGSMYTYLAFIDVALTEGAGLLHCTSGAFTCFISAQPCIQMLLSAALSTGLWFWFLRFDEAVPVSVDEAGIEESGFANTFYRMLPPVYFFQANVVLLGLVSGSAVLVSRTGDVALITSFAHACGLASAALNAVMWMPQIIVTAAFGHKGALSVHWVIASIVMDVVYSVYLALLGYDVSVWLNNVPDGIQTAVLFGIIAYVERRDALAGSDEFGRRKSVMGRIRGRDDNRPEMLALLDARRRGEEENGGYSAIPDAADV